MRRIEQYYPVGLNRGIRFQVLRGNTNSIKLRTLLSFDLSLLALGLLEFEVEIDDVL